MFIADHEYRRRALHELYGGTMQAGIAPSSSHPIVFLFSGPQGEQYGYQDGWQPDGSYHYSGEGQRGDMVFAKGNKAIRDHVEQKRDIHLFEYTGKSGIVRYVGEMLYTGHYFRSAPDITGVIRQAIVFELRRVQDQ